MKKFTNAQERQAYLDSIARLVTETTNVQPHPECPGYTIEKNHVEIATVCLQLENDFKELSDLDAKKMVRFALRTVEVFYEEHLNRRITMPFLDLMDVTWLSNEIAHLQMTLQNVQGYAPTVNTCELYCDYVKRYSTVLQELLDKKTPGHPAHIAAVQEQYQAEMRSVLESAHEYMNTPGAHSPRFFALPKRPGVEADILEILEVTPDAGQPVTVTA